MTTSQNVTEDTALAVAQCSNADNSAMSCYPTNQTRLAQAQDLHFVWNSRLREFTQTEHVDVQLFRVDSNGTAKEVYQWNSINNPTEGEAGQLSVPVMDVLSWLNDLWEGELIVTSMYFAIGQAHAQDEGPQALFQLIQSAPVPGGPISPSAPTASVAIPASSASASAASDTIQSGPHVSPGVIAGAIIGGATAMALLLLAAWLIGRRWHLATRSQDGVKVDWKPDSETGSIVSEDNEKVSMHDVSSSKQVATWEQ